MEVFERVRDLRKNILHMTQEEFAESIKIPVLIWVILKQKKLL